eukprot:jgi/Tetstr1/455620/TSEL_042432.t1
MSLLDEVNRTLDKNSTEPLVDFLDREWEAIQAYDAAMERAKIKALKIKYPGDSQAKASIGAALAAFEDDNTAAVTDQPSDDTDVGDELTLEEEEMLLSGGMVPVVAAVAIMEVAVVAGEAVMATVEADLEADAAAEMLAPMNHLPSLSKIVENMIVH